MGGLAFSFGAPLVLLGLLSLPVIWWLLRLTPPSPVREAFPPLRILLQVLKAEETPAKTSWWLVLLRLLLAALIIFALAAPVVNPRQNLLTGAGPLALILDNGWASATSWQSRHDTAAGLIREAGDAGRPVSLVLTAEGASNDATPTEAAQALERLDAAQPRPVPTNRQAAAGRLTTALAGQGGTSLAYLSDGLETSEREAAAEELEALSAEQFLLFQPDISAIIALTGVSNAADALTVSAIRAPATGPATRQLRALDRQGRELARTELSFTGNDTTGQAGFTIPVELRNDVARVDVVNQPDAAGTRLLDESAKRRRVALLAGGDASSMAQPLLSPLYYITRALQPFADLTLAQDADLTASLTQILETNPSVVVLADIGAMPQSAAQELTRFVEGGGTILRFAGPRLAAAAATSPLLPVRLRQGERQFGGALSWSEPQKIAPMEQGSPFYGIQVPQDIVVSRQILAEPSSDLAGKTWASLTDGTPIVTAEALGAGEIVLFHITDETSWSNLPISGAFVEMLRRIVIRSQAAGSAPGEQAEASYPPYLMLNAHGVLTPPDSEVKPLIISGGAMPPVSRDAPPGLYGSEDGYIARNLLSAGSTLELMGSFAATGSASTLTYETQEPGNLAPWLFAAALVLFALDCLAMLWLNGVFARFSTRRAGSGLAVMLLCASLSLALAGQPLAQETDDPALQGLGDLDSPAIVEATRTTHLAYVRTGDAGVDEISERGLYGLSQFIGAKTALEPGDPVGVDIAADELAFYPILYWPVSAKAPMPSAQAIGRIDAYMKQGGTVLFDVDEAAMQDLTGNGVSAGQRRLRDILADLNIPPLEPVSGDHVLTKSFYIMNNFPGRHTGSQLWSEALQRQDGYANRPAVAGDGVSPILITGNDFASAWAVDDSGLFLYPTDTTDPAQREFAYRAGVNIVMYVLTGNYKADQVHISALLERLGQ
ncbi:DUF4159 domain-containing protein [Aureimonas fodinaquatilis]|uniref:DUF4159 domain-containing protein n=1 Tax=Aureimonas fodinaquatilis TaxID=2565783 RepID=A0A5B0E024_9HYPH|nr:DUF4159 domain-containing protein [Aureimonas fodinaquatilis]KAA0972046.1 DUF4159 domain-containing protein [Aureimonas fodinaquatilis]